MPILENVHLRFSHRRNEYLNNFHRAFDVRVVAAEQDLDVVSGWEQVRFVKAITLHPDFNLTTFRNDIAMLEVLCR